jgi:coenzyme F420-reducing hydrogenase delta subunit
MVEQGYRLPEGIRTFELPCTGRVSDVLLLESLQNGERAILVVGCRKENCKYLDGNLRAEKRVQRAAGLIEKAGISDKSVKMLFVAPDEGRRLSEEIHAFLTTIDEAAKEPAATGG